MAARPGRPRRAIRRRRWWIPGVVGFLTVTLVLVVVHQGSSEGFTDMSGHRVVPDEEVPVDNHEAIAMVLEESGPQFEIPSVGLSAPLGSILDVDGVMYPPNYDSVFHVRNRGVSLREASQGTVFLVAHSTAGGKSPGNFIQNKQQITVNQGEQIIVGDLVYQVVSTTKIPKDQIGEDATLWESIPGRLVFLTCAVEPHSGPSTTNIVVIGELTGAHH